MPKAQRLYSSWRYNWKYNKHKIWRDVICPCLLAVVLALWFSIIFWFLLDTHEKFKHFKYGSFPIPFIAIVWAGVKSVISVVEPVGSQMVDYLCLPDHSTKLGYQQKVIEDINFLKHEALSCSPNKCWNAFAWIWCLITFSWDERYVHLETKMPKIAPASKDQLRIVVFVDDLDRCQENVILQVLSAINLVLAVCKIDVILGMDKSMIERAVRRMFGDKNKNPSKSSQDLADKYLKKIVQLPLDLPDPSYVESRQFLLGQLGMLDTSKGITDTVTDPAPNEKERMIPEFPISRRNLNPGLQWDEPEIKETGIVIHQADHTEESSNLGEKQDTDTAEGADSHLSDKKEQPKTIGESNLQRDELEMEETDIVIHQAHHIEESSNLGEKQDTGVPTNDEGLMTCLRKCRSYLSSLYKYGDNTHSRQWPSMKNKDQGKVKPTPENEDQGTPQNIISIEMIMPKYSEGEGNAFLYLQNEATGSKKLPRERKRLITYHRLAWNILSKRRSVTKLDDWRVQLIIWIFVCWEWKDQINTLIQKWHKLDVLTNWVTDHQQGEAESSGPSLREIVEKYMEKEKKEKTSHIQKEKGKSPKTEQEEEKEREEWIRLRKTLRKYNVSMDGIQAFQNFRFYCMAAYLPWPLPKEYPKS